RALLVSKLPLWEIHTYQDFEKYLDLQLERLQTDHLDICLLHSLCMKKWQKCLKIGVFDFLNKAKADGKILMTGFSIHDTTETMKAVLDSYDWDMMLMQYNYYDRFHQVEEKGLRYAASKNVAVMIMEPLRGGMLAKNIPDKVEAALATVMPQAKHHEKAFAWLYDQPEVTVILSGCVNMEQLQDNIRIFANAQSNIFNEEEKEDFDQARLAWKENIMVPCTACGYCLACPLHLDIPGIFKLYNDRAGDKVQLENRNLLYKNIYTIVNKDATQCISCRKCTQLCPQSLDIPTILAQAHQAMTAPIE
ncbi:MAG: aldo/keto reductase, partial [Clostridiales bacterium]